MARVHAVPRRWPRLHNSAAERGVAVGRRNWTFWVSDSGGHRAAVNYTLIETAELNGVDPRTRLADVLARIGDHPMRLIDELPPWNWNVSRRLNIEAANQSSARASPDAYNSPPR